MDLLQSFMSCMYPDIIRTESIESMEQDCRFQAANIDEQGNEISNGELQITNDDLIYFKPSKFPTRWPLNSIRRYGSIDDGQKFIFEVGRKCSTGQAIFAFKVSLDRGHELAEKLSEKIDVKLSTCANATNSSKSGFPNRYNIMAKSTATTSNQKQLKCDASTLTSPLDQSTDPRPLSYALIDFKATQALNESAKAIKACDQIE